METIRNPCYHRQYDESVDYASWSSELSLAAIHMTSRSIDREDDLASPRAQPIRDIKAAQAMYVRVARQIVPLAQDEDALDGWWDGECRNRGRLGIVYGDTMWAELVSIVETHRAYLVGPIPAGGI